VRRPGRFPRGVCVHRATNGRGLRLFWPCSWLYAEIRLGEEARTRVSLCLGTKWRPFSPKKSPRG
jgi:hypothetical protein